MRIFSRLALNEGRRRAGKGARGGVLSAASSLVQHLQIFGNFSILTNFVNRRSSILCRFNFSPLLFLEIPDSRSGGTTLSDSVMSPIDSSSSPASLQFAAPPPQQEGEDRACGANLTGKKPAWNVQMNGASNGASVIGDDSWPALSQSAKGIFKSSLSDTTKTLQDQLISAPLVSFLKILFCYVKYATLMYSCVLFYLYLRVVLGFCYDGISASTMFSPP